MVEFGLKLDDNKVSEWSEFYLDYDRLKTILKKAKANQKKYDEQAKRRPDDAAKISQAHRMGIQENVVSITPSGSSVNLAQSLQDNASETTSLLLPDSKAQPSEASAIGASSAHQKSGGVAILPSFSLPDMQGYFSSRYERTLRVYLKEADDREEEFSKAVKGEQAKVVKFYDEKLSELEKRLSLLIESVASSSNFKRAFSLSKVDEEDITNGMRDSRVMAPGMGTHHRRSASEMTTRERLDKMIHKLQNTLHDAPILKEIVGQSASDGKGKKHYFPHSIATKLPSNGDSDDEGEHVDDEKAFAEADSVKRALIDQYRTAKLLQNYAILNYTGFVKIIKKHDKTMPEKKGRFKKILEPESLFNEGKAVEKLGTQYETYYANWFCEGDVRTAHAQMLPKRGDGLEMDWSQLRLGYRMGMAAVLALWVCWDSIWGLVADGNSTIGGRSAFPVFRACGGILLLQWCWGCSVFVWTRYRINYIYLFDFNPKIVATSLGIFERAVDNTLVFMLLMLLYYKSGAKTIPQVLPDGAYPFILVVYTAYQLIFPLRSRRPMWEAIGSVITAPLHSPSFFHGYVGDIFTSMVKVFQDIAWTLCWVFSGDFTRSEDLKNGAMTFEWSNSHWYKNFLIPLLCLFPLLIRFNQCLRRYIDTGHRFPHLANATKYALSQTVTLFGAFHPLYLEYIPEKRGSIELFQVFWVVVFVSSSLFSFTWDVYMDWGLGRRKYNFLGPTLMYPRHYYYYSVIAIDIVLRFMWVLTLVPPSSGAKFEVPSYLTAVTMMLELFRRTTWGFFRLENEHRSNAAGFRRVGFVPLHFNTGHQHGYADKQEKSGMAVLQEVVLIALAVGAVCVWSVVSAQRATRATADLRMEL